MRRKASPQKANYKWRRKLFAVLIVCFCISTLVLLEAQFRRIKMLTSLYPSVVRKPQIAFLFIARNRLPLDMVWDAFFQGDKEEKSSVFVHSTPGFLFNEATTRSAYFLNRQLNDSIQTQVDFISNAKKVDWGEATMIVAERILLKNALTDPYNDRFVFLSDSCIPLYNFTYTYEYIMSTSTSFVDSFADTKEARYNPKMHPVIPIQNWKKGSQWVVLTRKHAEIVVKDEVVLPLFQRYCKRKSLPEFWQDHPLPPEGWKEHNCIPDEHYVQTLLACQHQFSIQSKGVHQRIEGRVSLEVKLQRIRVYQVAEQY